MQIEIPNLLKAVGLLSEKMTMMVMPVKFLSIVKCTYNIKFNVMNKTGAVFSLSMKLYII